MTRYHERSSLLREARQELSESAEDLFYVADLLHQAGDFSAAAHVAKLAEGVMAEAQSTQRAS